MSTHDLKPLVQTLQVMNTRLYVQKRNQKRTLAKMAIYNAAVTALLAIAVILHMDPSGVNWLAPLQWINSPSVYHYALFIGVGVWVVGYWVVTSISIIRKNGRVE